MRMKKVVVAGLVGVMSMSALAGCGSSDKKGGDTASIPSDPFEIADMASERTNDLDSYELNGKMELEVGASGQTVTAQLDMSAVYFKDPMKMKMKYDLTADAAGQKIDMTADAYFMKEDDSYVMYVGYGMKDADEQWSKIALDSSNSTQKQIIDALDVASKGEGKSSMDEFKDAFALDKENNTDDATALLFTLTADEIAKAYKEAGSTSDASLAAYGMTMDDVCKAMGDLKVNMSVDTDQVYWKSIKMDLAKPIQGIIDVAMESAAEMYGSSASDMKVELPKFSFDINYDKYNDATDFELPAEAKDAKEVDLTSLLTSAMMQQ